MRKKHKKIVVILSFLIIGPSGFCAYGQNRSTPNGAILPQPQGSAIGHEYVDLGLSVLWATCNIGASFQEEYGSFFPWGEVSNVDSFSWESYVFGELTGDNKHMLNKYIPKTIPSYGINGYSDGLITLKKEDDVANAQWGNNWRIPTRDEFRELCSKCTLKWVTINGHNGYLFTADNSNSIFLPAAGNREGDLYYWDENRYGYYWSSDVYKQKPEDAWGLCFHRGIADVTHGVRNRGFCIRPVIDK